MTDGQRAPALAEVPRLVGVDSRWRGKKGLASGPPAPESYFLKVKNTWRVEPSTSVTVTTLQVPAHDFSVFQA